MHPAAARPASAVVALLLVTGCGADPVRLDDRSTRTAVLSYVAAQQDDGSRYRRPPAAAADALVGAVLALGHNNRAAADRMAREQAYRVVELPAGVLALVPSELPDSRGWGLYVVRPAGLDLVVEVPHPRADLDTERLGAEVAEAMQARYLLVAGAARDAGGGAADVAHQSDAVFSAVHEALARQGVPALQLHGFAASSLPGVDLVVSPGAAALSPLARRIADLGEEGGLSVCRAWTAACGRLEGRTNVQGRASRDAGSIFVHLEVTRALRERERQATLVDLLARAASA